MAINEDNLRAAEYVYNKYDVTNEYILPWRSGCNGY